MVKCTLLTSLSRFALLYRHHRDDKALAALATACETNAGLVKNLRDFNLTDQTVGGNERAIKKLQKVCFSCMHLLYIPFIGQQS